MDIMWYYALVGFVKTTQSAPPVEQMLNHCDTLDQSRQAPQSQY